MHELVYKVDAAYREIEHGMCTSGGYHREVPSLVRMVMLIGPDTENMWKTC